MLIYSIQSFDSDALNSVMLKRTMVFVFNYGVTRYEWAVTVTGDIKFKASFGLKQMNILFSSICWMVHDYTFLGKVNTV